MANNKYYGYNPKTQKGNVGIPYGENRKLVNQNPHEFKKGMDYELTSLGCARLRESTPEEREKATESVLTNLDIHPSYYTAKVQFETKNGRNFAAGPGEKAISFKKWLAEFYDENQMKPVDKSYKNDKMVKLKEAIKKSVRKKLSDHKDKDVYDMEDTEPTKAQLKGIDNSIADAKEALVNVMSKVKDLGPDIKKLAKETNSKIQKNPAGKADYLKVYQSDPDVKEFIKLRRMLKAADLL